MKLKSPATLALCAVTILVGCGDEKTAGKITTAKSYFGDTIAPPGDLAKIKKGMTIAEAQRLVPDIKKVGKYYKVDSGFSNLEIYVSVTKDLVDHIDYSFAEKRAGVKASLLEAWGAGEDSKYSDQLHNWHNDKSGYKAELSCVGRCSVAIENYTPLTHEFFGEEIAPPSVLANIAFLSTPLLGLTVDEIKAAYPANLANDGQVGLSFPPTEYGKYQTPVSLLFSQGKAANVRFSISYQGRAGAKDEILAFMKKKWGEPTIGTDYQKSLVFRAAAPVIKVNDSPISEEFDITLTSPIN